MGKLIKWFFGILIFLIVLVVAAVVILPMVIDPNDYKGEIQAAVKKQTGRDLAIEQPLSLSVFPHLAVALGGVTLSNAEGFGREPFARVEALDLKVKVMPLLERRVEVDTVVLKGMTLNLAKDAKGRGNWDDLVAKQEKEEKEPAEVKREEAGQAFSFAVKGVEIEDTRVVWDDRQAGQRVEISDIRLRTGELAPGATVPLEGGLKLVSDKPKMTLVFGADGDLQVSTDLARFQAKGLNLTLAAQGEGLPQQGVDIKLSSDLVLDQTAGTLRMDNLKLTGADVSLSGKLDVTQLNAEPAVSADLALQKTNLKQLAALFGSQIQTTDPQALSSVSGKFIVKASGQSAEIKPLTLKLDDSNLDGFIRVASFTGPTVRAELKLDQIDLDRYLPPAGEAAAAKPASGSSDKAAANPFAGLRTLDLDATASIGQLTVNKLKMSAVTVTAKSKNGVLRLSPIGAKLYEGAFNGEVELDARQATPKIRLKPKLDGVKIGPLMQDMTGDASVVGTGNVDADISMVGMSEAEVRRSLNGNAKFVLRDASVKALIGAIESIRKADVAFLGGQSSDLRSTDFSELTGSAVITNGVVDNQDLKAQSPLLRLAGKGTVNLPQNSLDYLATIELVKTLKGQGGAESKDLSGIPIPVKITGNLNDPKFKPDLQAALSAKAKEQLEAKLDEQKGKIEQQVTEKIQKQVGEEAGKVLGDQLKGLFGR